MLNNIFLYKIWQPQQLSTCIMKGYGGTFYNLIIFLFRWSWTDSTL